MALNKISYEEMMLLQILGLSSMMPHYWSELILLAERLLEPREREEMNQMIFDIEKMVLETEVVAQQDEDGKIVWVEKIKGELSLYDIEMAFESNQDYYSYFQRDDGRIITKFDIERRLDKLRKWLYAKVTEKSAGRRFSRMR